MDSRRIRILPALLCLCLCLTLFSFRLPAASAETEVPKVLATISYVPVALMEAGDITAATSTSGIYITEYNWYDIRGNYLITSRFGSGPVAVAITFATHDGFVFSGGVDVYLNNEPAAYEMSPDRHYLTLMRTYDPQIWLPSVIKNPGDEYLDEGRVASFVAAANYAEGFQWFACDPATGEEISVYEIPEMIDINSDGVQSRVNIYGVPAWMDGWQVYCRFVGALGVSQDSSRATMHVNPVYSSERPEESPEPSPTPSPAPSPSPTPSPTPRPTPTPTPLPTPTPPPAHVHDFPETWHYDETIHWRECSCGERIEQGAHSMDWQVEKPATRRQPGLEHGKCTICGFEAVRELAYVGPSDAVRLAITGVGGLVALTVIVLIADSIRHAIRKKRR